MITVFTKNFIKQTLTKNTKKKYHIICKCSLMESYEFVLYKTNFLDNFFANQITVLGCICAVADCLQRLR